MPPPPCWTKKNLAKCQICLETNSTHVASTRAVLEVGGGINGIKFYKKIPPKLGHIPGGLAFFRIFFDSWGLFYKNLIELAWFGKEFHLDLKLNCLRLNLDIFALLGHILKRALCNQVFVFIVFVNEQIHSLRKTK